MSVDLIVAAGQWNHPGSPADVARVWGRQRRRADIIVRTEAGNYREQFLLATLHGGRSVNRARGGNKGDVAIESRSRFHYSQRYPLSDLTYDGRECWAAESLLSDSDGDTFVIGVHMPARVEPGFRVRKIGTRHRVHRQGYRRLRAEIAEIRAAWPKARIILAGDFNMDFRKAWVRARYRWWLRGTGLHFYAKRPRGGWRKLPADLGNRSVVAVFTNREVTTHFMRENPVSDHRYLWMRVK